MAALITQRDSERRWIFIALVVLATWVGREFDGPNMWYPLQIGEIPLQYLLIAGALALLAPLIFSTPRFSVAAALSSLGLWRWVSLGWLALLIALTTGVFGQAPELFADWRNLIVMTLITGAAARWLSSQSWKTSATLDIAIAYGVLSIGLVVSYALGQGVSVLGVRSPVFHGPTLFMTVFAAIVCINVWLGGLSNFPSGLRFLIPVAATSASTLIVLSFRRSFWLALALGLIAVFGNHLRQRAIPRIRLIGAASLMLGVVCVGFAFLGTERMIDRLASFVPTSDNEFAVTNDDHINDVIDALGVVRESPVLGLGIGRYYETNLIADWKASSFEVHNALVHVWLKFGLIGMVAYLGFHLRWIRAAFGANGDPRIHVVFFGTGAYLAAELTATMVGTWPYGSVQMSVFHGVILGSMLACVNMSRKAPVRSLVAAPSR